MISSTSLPRRIGTWLYRALRQILRKGLLLVALYFGAVFAYERSDLMKHAVDTAASGVANVLVDHYYRHVNVSEDGEMPPSATSYSYGPLMSAAIGGKGEGLNCSIPALANPSFRLERGDAGVSHKFHQACVTHDLCYRHGLATYGHTQADCDFALQQSAFRLCPYQHDGDEREIARCRIRAKIALLGVRFGGSKSYRGWDGSTYYEYENVIERGPNTVLARSVPRVPQAPDLPRETIRRFLPPAGGGTSSQRLGRHQDRDGLLTAPVVLSGTDARLAFLQRLSVSNTVTKVTSLAATLPADGAPPTYSVDMFGSTPVALPHLGSTKGPVLFALTPQRTRRLSGMLFDPEAPCPPLRPRELPRALTVWPSPIVGNTTSTWTEQQRFELTDLEQYVYRFFQQAPIPGPFALAGGKQADVLITTHGRTHSGGGAMSGNDYRDSIDIIALGLKTERNPTHCAMQPGFQMFRRVPVTETMQPLVRLETLRGGGLIGMQKVEERGAERLKLHEVWLDGDAATLRRGQDELPPIDGAFADRPPLVLKPGALGPGSDAGIILSRARIVASTGPSTREATSEIVRFQLAALSRAHGRWEVSHAATCHVRYDFPASGRSGLCSVSNPDMSFPFLPRRWTRPLAWNTGPSVGNQLRAAQMLAGQFVKGDGLGLAVMDMCHGTRPVLFTPVRGEAGSIGHFAPVDANIASRTRPVVAVRGGEPQVLTHERQVSCLPMPASCLAEPLDSKAFRDRGPCSGL